MPAGRGDEGLVQVHGSRSAVVRMFVGNGVAESYIIASFGKSLAGVERSTWHKDGVSIGRVYKHCWVSIWVYRLQGIVIL